MLCGVIFPSTAPTIAGIIFESMAVAHFTTVVVGTTKERVVETESVKEFTAGDSE